MPPSSGERPSSGDSLDHTSLAAAMAQSYARDQQGFASLVAMMLESSLPNHIEVVRKPVRLFSSEKRVASVKITFGDTRFDLDDPGGGALLVAKKIKIVQGIVLRTQQITVPDWLAEIDTAVNEYAQGNEYASNAIADFLKQHGL